MAKPINYYTLAVKSQCDNKWSPEFGDYDKETVQYELQEFRRNYSAKRLKIIVTGDKQADIDAAIKAMNEDND